MKTHYQGRLPKKEDYLTNEEDLKNEEEFKTDPEIRPVVLNTINPMNSKKWVTTFSWIFHFSLIDFS